MYRKHVAYLAIVSLKFFLNIDHDISTQIMVVGLLMAAFVKHCYTSATETVDEVLTFAVNAVDCYKEKLRYRQDNLLALRSGNSLVDNDVLQWNISK